MPKEYNIRPTNDKSKMKTIPVTPALAIIIVRACRQPCRISDIQSLKYNLYKIDTRNATGIWNTIQYAINYVNTTTE